LVIVVFRAVDLLSASFLQFQIELKPLRSTSKRVGGSFKNLDEGLAAGLIIGPAVCFDI
jgi:hypothetical protein